MSPRQKKAARKKRSCGAAEREWGMATRSLRKRTAELRSGSRRRTLRPRPRSADDRRPGAYAWSDSSGRLLPLHQLALLGAPRLRLGFADALSSRDERGNQRYERGAVALRNPVRPRRTDELRHRCSRTRRRAGARAACAGATGRQDARPRHGERGSWAPGPATGAAVGAFLSEGDGYGSSDAAVAARDERDSAPQFPCAARQRTVGLRARSHAGLQPRLSALTLGVAGLARATSSGA